MACASQLIRTPGIEQQRIDVDVGIGSQRKTQPLEPSPHVRVTLFQELQRSGDSP